MEKKVKGDFCTTCRKNTEYNLQKQNIKKVIRNKEYAFNITSAVCNQCKKEMNIPGLIDLNIKEIDEQYRKYEDIVTIDDIEKLMNIYDIGKSPLSLALGFGEITITRYLAGQIPSKEYSDIIKDVLSNPSNMKKKLNENKDKVAPVTYDKSIKIAIKLEELFSVSEKMLSVLSYVFESIEEITPLALQKLLYFIQGLSYALNDRPMFLDECCAWVHGPVYPKVYNLFKNFKYNPIDDDRFVIFKKRGINLNENERKVIDLVVNTFGEYSGKVLEKITHTEKPWVIARKGYFDDVPSYELITNSDIKSYFKEMNKIYDFSSKEGIKEYIKEKIK